MNRVSRERLAEPIKFLSEDMPELLQKTAAIGKGYEYWEMVVEECKAINDKYGNKPFIRHMLLAYCDYLDKNAGGKHEH